MNIFDLRMNGFTTETAVCLQTLHYSVLICVANALYAQMIHMINCSEVFTKSFAFQESILIYSVQICRQVPLNIFFFFFFFGGGGCIVIALRAEKTYLAIQTWRMVKWFLYPCYDVGCYLW